MGGQADLVVEPSELTYHLKPGVRSEREITITNRTDKPIRFTKYETNCECVSLHWPAIGLAISHGCSVQLTMAVDMSHDPKYRGSFAQEVRIFEAGSKV
jgi:hypothetical protein